MRLRGGTMITTTFHVDLARETDAVDLAQFADELGLRARISGTSVEFLEERDLIGDVVTTWLSEHSSELVPTRLEDGSIALRPPAP
jgi:hypothetical protein